MDNDLHRPSLAVIVAAVALTLLVAILVYSLQVNRDLASQGAQTHQAVCAWRSSLDDQLAQNRTFLALTVPEREAKYGKALGDIPDNIIKRSIAAQETTLRSLGALTCP